MGGYKFGKGIPSWNGVPMIGGVPVTEGNYYFVDYGAGSDGNGTKSNSMTRAFKTIDKAVDVASSNNNDVICLVGSDTHVLTEMLTLSKNRVHMVGLDGAGRYYGQGAKVSLGVTTAATDIGAVKNTGVRNSFDNIKFISNNTKDESLYTFLDGGEYMRMNNCEIYKSTDLDVTGAAELVMNGDSPIITNTTIGSTANAISGAIVRANVLLTKGLAGSGKVSRDVTFENCKFWKRASNVANRYFYGANATDVERSFVIKDSMFFNTKLAAALPAQCVELAAEQTQGFVLIDNCSSINNTKLSTTTGVYITGPVPTYATSGIAVAS
jgi:hypothetical protein